MLMLLPDLPPGVVGVESQGKVTAEDYEHVLVPAVEAAQAASANGQVRILYILGHEADYTAGAAWEDTKLGLGHIKHWERIAIVTDAEWLRYAVHALGWMMPGEVELFQRGDVDQARAWVLS